MIKRKTRMGWVSCPKDNVEKTVTMVDLHCGIPKKKCEYFAGLIDGEVHCKYPEAEHKRSC